ncbi:hypothetical protein Q4Q57_13140 [Shewanella sp. SP2S2-6]|uniref:hypothetical protein n=1 Tax=Shewanella sp. SP2S2-6 TaxID=3063540 RepID=UPI0028911DB2|nr:hypothetical protein [Shewanella sp. SP2S2-6]MDT3296086.1 hypothetical protein [Shewanella sp. SP2S2-6]
MTTNPPRLPQADQAQVPHAEKSFKWLIILLALVASCLLAFYFSIFHGGVGDKGDFGAFGDYFGGVLNPILGFATVGLLVWSLKYQMDELALTRQVLKETQKEAALSRQAMEAQVEHLQKEAKLNELTRLLERAYKKYEVITSTPFPVTMIKNTMLNETYYSLLHNRIQYFDIQTKNEINNIMNANKDMKTKLDKVRRETILISDLALKYYSINESTEFARAYLFDSFDMLQAVERIYQNEITQDRLSTIASLMGEFLDVAKVPSITES